MPQSVTGSKKGKDTTQIMGSSPQGCAAEKPVEQSQVRDKQVDQRSLLSKKLSEYKQRIQELETELAASRAEAEQFKANLEAMVNVDTVKHIADLEKRLAEGDQQLQELADMEERVKDMGGDLQYAREAQETLRAELDRVQGELKAAQEQLTQAQAAQPQADDGTVKELQKELAAANDKLTQLEAAATQAIRQNTEACGVAVNEANTRVRELEARLANPGQELAAAQKRAADALVSRDGVAAEAFKAAGEHVQAIDEYHKSLAKERDSKHSATFVAIILGLLLLVVGGVSIYLAFFRGSTEETLAQPAQTFLGHKLQTALAKTVDMTTGGSFQVTPDNLKAFTGQSDPTCYVSNKLSMWSKDKKQTHFECNGQASKDTSRDCWNVSACTIEVPKDLKK